MVEHTAGWPDHDKPPWLLLPATVIVAELFIKI